VLLIEMSDAFERGWSLVKMARHKIGPTEIWDIDESRRFAEETTSDKQVLDEMGIEDTYSSPWNDEAIRTHIPLGGSQVFGNYAEKIMMTPREFLRLAGKVGLDDPDRKEYIKNMARQMEQGLPVYNPLLLLSRRGETINDIAGDASDYDYRITGHEGRHRMAALAQLGFIDEKIPVQVSTSEYHGNPYSESSARSRPYRYDEDDERFDPDDPGRNYNYLDAITNARIQPEDDLLFGDIERIRPFARRLTLDEQFKITPDRINNLWGRGKVEQLTNNLEEIDAENWRDWFNRRLWKD
tara:strand:- start:6685 stop:7575 length:891 start_codon:yes stop_codon:yes gene_type:complete